jgi:hypothetical protein
MMNRTVSKSNETVKWAPEGSPVTVEYTLDLMAQIRDHVIVGFHRLAKRGIECGGILYGRRDGDRIVLEQIREIRCEYRLGPSFVLSDNDRETLARQLRESGDGLEGLSAVGMYVSHTKDDILATERDLAVFDGFFKESWQVMLILRPARQGSVRAGFFVREADGGLRGEASYEEFELAPPDSAAEAAALLAAARTPLEAAYNAAAGEAVHPNFAGGARAAGRGGSGAAAAPARARQAFVPEFGGNGAADGPEFARPGDPGRSMVYAQGRQLAPNSQLQESAEYLRQGFHPAFPSKREKHWKWLALWAVGILTFAGAAYFFLSMRSPSPLLLRVAEQHGDLRIEWDRASTSIQRAGNGTLEIRDGSTTRDLRLSPEQLANGYYLFPIVGGDVSVRLAVTGMLIPRVEESVNFVAEAKPGEIDASRLSIENRNLRNDLLKQRETNEKLEQRMRALEERLLATPGAPGAARKTGRTPRRQNSAPATATAANP